MAEPAEDPPSLPVEETPSSAQDVPADAASLDPASNPHTEGEPAEAASEAKPEEPGEQEQGVQDAMAALPADGQGLAEGAVEASAADPAGSADPAATAVGGATEEVAPADVLGRPEGELGEGGEAEGAWAGQAGIAGAEGEAGGEGGAEGEGEEEGGEEGEEGEGEEEGGEEGEENGVASVAQLIGAPEGLSPIAVKVEGATPGSGTPGMGGQKRKRNLPGTPGDCPRNQTNLYSVARIEAPNRSTVGEMVLWTSCALQARSRSHPSHTLMCSFLAPPCGGLPCP